MKNKTHIIPMAAIFLLFATTSGPVSGFCGFFLQTDTTVALPTCYCSSNNVAVMRSSSSGCETKCISSKISKHYISRGWTYGCCLSARLSDNGFVADGPGIFPNPVAGVARITFSLKMAQPVSIRLMDVNGKLVRVVTEKVFGEGTNEINWNTSDLNNGIYLVEFRSGEFLQTKKLMVVK